MLEWIGIFLTSFAALFVVLDSIGNVPIFDILNSRYSIKNKHKNVRIAVFIAAFILIAFLFLGSYILTFFGITLSGFRIAGGIILFIIGLKIVLGVQSNNKEEYSDIAVIPMATPLIAGPATITTVMILVGSYGYLIPLLALLANLIITFLMLTYADKVTGLIGKQGSEVVSKILGMILVAISVQMVIGGVGGFLIPGIIKS